MTGQNNNNDRSKEKQVHVCPVCSQHAMGYRNLSSDFLSSRLSSYFGLATPDRIGLIDYAMFRCTACNLEFADPMVPGTRSFYEWVTTMSGYFTENRWEWHAVLEQLGRGAEERVLDVGCGSGEFLDLTRRTTKAQVTGLDVTEPAVTRCTRKGIEAYCQTIEQYSSQRKSSTTAYDVVVAFHSLEHVPDPVGFVQSMLSVAKPGGKIFISVPCSPMSFETRWYDPLNHPPHHLTRWNENSFRSLAKRLDCNLRLFLPPTLSAWRRTRYALSLRYPRSRRIHRSPPGRLVQTFVSVIHFMAFIEEARNQNRRFKIGEQVAPDAMLGRFSRTAIQS